MRVGRKRTIKLKKSIRRKRYRTAKRNPKMVNAARAKRRNALKIRRR